MTRTIRNLLFIFSFLTACVALSTRAAAAEVGNMTFYAQEQSNWCWAASTQVVALHNGVGSLSQCNMASRWVANTSDGYCCNAANAQSSYCNRGGVPETTLGFYGILDRQSSYPLPQADIVSEVRGGYPLIITVMWPQGGGHALTIYGAASYASNGGRIDTVNIWDSANGGDKVVVSRYQAEHYSNGTWTRTMTSKCPNNKCSS